MGLFSLIQTLLFSQVGERGHIQAAGGLPGFRPAPAAPSLREHTAQTPPPRSTRCPMLRSMPGRRTYRAGYCWVLVPQPPPRHLQQQRFQAPPGFLVFLLPLLPAFACPGETICATSLVFLCSICTVLELKSHKEPRFDGLPLIKAQELKNSMKTVEKQKF